ncbi:hypothetical protein B0H17DRAFT_1206678 [Mycena rosella]|uniref:EF-hand domain-containing protein n=1 Tax=Mycena rosella TaxID=1033263 RepID=A0AAD7D4P3_MYCRO|nr:hypothetical protein B0H17DRAFT_1206678 [Mycena rosella]
MPVAFAPARLLTVFDGPEAETERVTGAYGAAPPGGAYGALPGAGLRLGSRRSTRTDRAVMLQRALINSDWTAFDLDTVKLLMTIFDTDRSGTTGFNDSGSIDVAELRDALAQFGYNLSPTALRLAQLKYGEPASLSFLLRVPTAQSSTLSLKAPLPPRGGGMPGMPGHAGGGGLTGISFDRFVRACVVVKQLSEAFGRLDADRDG